jgi:hypothetical protein
METELFIPANDLERLIMQAALDPALRPEFYRTIRTADFYVLTPDNASAEAAPAGNQIDLVGWDGEQGRFIPVFTSTDRIEEALEGSFDSYSQIILNAEELFSILISIGQPATINPCSAYGKELTVDEMRGIADESIFRRTKTLLMKKKSTVLMGQPEDYPQHLIDALARYFADQPTVEAAYVAQIHDKSAGDPPHCLIGIRSSGDSQRIIGEASVIAREILCAGEFVDFLAMGDGEIEDHLASSTEPFYLAEEAAKKRWKLW